MHVLLYMKRFNEAAAQTDFCLSVGLLLDKHNNVAVRVRAVNYG